MEKFFVSQKRSHAIEMLDQILIGLCMTRIYIQTFTELEKVKNKKLN